MHGQALFIRKTTLGPDEYQANFTLTDNDILDAITSDEALQVTVLMPAIYMRLKRTPREFWEREGVLRFTGSTSEGEATAWEQLRRLCGVSNSTLSKALKWMHAKGVIGYDARKNGVGIRIFFNRAAASIRYRGGQKNLRLVPAPAQPAPAPTNRVAFKEHDSGDNLDIYPNSSADAEGDVKLDEGQLNPLSHPAVQSAAVTKAPVVEPQSSTPNSQILAATLRQALVELKPELTAAVKRESENTREWLLKYALPKAARVAQHETYNMLRANGVIAKVKQNTGPDGGAAARRSQNREENKITSFLAEAGREFCRLAASGGEQELLRAYQNAGRELNELHDRLTADTPLTTEEIESELAKIEQYLTGAIWETTTDEERGKLHKEALTELQGYQARMERAVFDDTVRHRMTAKLRARHGIPRLSLFYL